jgi:hypothetical protein
MDLAILLPHPDLVARLLALYTSIVLSIAKSLKLQRHALVQDIVFEDRAAVACVRWLAARALS